MTRDASGHASGHADGAPPEPPPRQGEIDAIVSLLDEVEAGDLDARLTEDLPAPHPLRALHARVNGLIHLLSVERERRARLQGELEERLMIIEMQRAALRELSTPIIEVWRGVLCLPIIGVIDQDRGAQITEQLLAAVSEKAAAHVIIDITGVDHMDSVMLRYFLSMANAIALLGASCVITGVRPAVAQTLAAMDVDTSAITPLRSLREALTRLVRRR